MYKNWAAISRTPNPWLRMLAATVTDADILGRLEKSFPELFSETQVVLHVPLSAIRQFIAEAEYNLWSGPLEHFSIPSFEWGGSQETISASIPLEMREVVASLPANAGEGDNTYDVLHGADTPHYVDWNGERCVIVEVYGYDPETGEVDGFTIVPVEFIDLTA